MDTKRKGFMFIDCWRAFDAGTVDHFHFYTGAIDVI